MNDERYKRLVLWNMIFAFSAFVCCALSLVALLIGGVR